jgi:hypothetical protein
LGYNFANAAFAAVLSLMSLERLNFSTKAAWRWSRDKPRAAIADMRRMT